MNVPRRTLLRVGLLPGVGLAGCADRAPSDDTPRGTAGLPRRLWFERVSLSASERGSVDPIAFGDLSGAEREIVRAALEEGGYAIEADRGSPAFDDLRDWIEDRTGNGETLTVYLRRGDAYYRVGFADGDHVIAHPGQ